MKYGIVAYQNTDNLGDDIQTYAAKCLLPSIDYIIDRENMDTFCPREEDTQVAIIMNGWYLHNKFNWPPSPYIYPLLISIHFTQNGYIVDGDDFLKGMGGDFLKKYQPVGVRDVSSLAMLRENNIDAYVSGCLTLTLPKDEKAKRNEQIVLVDIEKKQEKLIREKFPEKEITVITHTLQDNSVYSWEKKEQRVKKTLSIYQKAKCVITSRLHCALPCLAMGTPVLMLFKDDYMDRMESFLPLLHYDTENNWETAIEEFIRDPKPNKDDFKPIRNKLIKTCREFVEETKHYSRIEKVPLLEVFIHNWREKAIWQKALLQNHNNGYQKTITQLSSWTKQLEEAKEYISQQCENEKTGREKAEAALKEQKEWTEELSKTQTYLEQQCENEKTGREKAEAALKEQKEWTEELSKTQTYLEQQCENEKTGREKAEAALKEQKEWTEELTTAKNYLETQCEAALENCDQKQKANEELNIQLEKLEKERKQLEEQLKEAENQAAKWLSKLTTLTNDEKIQKIIKKRKYII